MEDLGGVVCGEVEKSGERARKRLNGNLCVGGSEGFGCFWGVPSAGIVRPSIGHGSAMNGLDFPCPCSVFVAQNAFLYLLKVVADGDKLFFAVVDNIAFCNVP